MRYAAYMKELLTKQYVEMQTAKFLSKNNKIYYGSSLPKVFHTSGFPYLFNQTL
jgi:hypothetical protein